MISPYRAIFAAPGSRAFSAAGLVGRMPLSMLGIGIVTMISQVTGQYGLAGALSATAALSGAAFGPQVSRLVDRYGQARVLRPAASVTVLSVLTLLTAVKAGAFVVTGLCAGLSGALLGLTLQSARPLVGTGYEFSAITAVVVGGVSIMGGFGSVPRAIAGLTFVQILTNVMVLQGVRTPIQGFVLGLLIAFAVALDVALRKRGVA